MLPVKLNFRRFFFRGLTILLPSVLTVWILIAAYGFVQEKIANPISAGVREMVLNFSDWPVAVEEKVVTYERTVEADPVLYAQWQTSGGSREWLRLGARREMLVQWWIRYPFPLDLIGLVVAVVLIYVAGAVLGSYIGTRMYKRGEDILMRIPLIRQVYPSVKQVTDFVVGGDEKEKIRFNQVVAVEYPRRGLWSVGLVTGDTMQMINEQSKEQCLTVFIPSSPTPFTGYVITVPKNDTVVLPISIDEALRFTISGGVILPASQRPPSSQSPVMQTAPTTNKP